MDSLGTSILWIAMLSRGAEGTVPVRTWVVLLEGILTVFISTGIAPLASFQFTTGESLRKTTAMRVAPATISLWRTARTAWKFHPLVATPSAVVCLTGGMTPWMIAGI